MWPARSSLYPGVVLGETGSNYQLADLHASDNGSVIVSFSRDRGFRTNRFLYANKLSASGQLMWGAGHVRCGTAGRCSSVTIPRSFPMETAAQYSRGIAAAHACSAMCSV